MSFNLDDWLKISAGAFAALRMFFGYTYVEYEVCKPQIREPFVNIRNSVLEIHKQTDGTTRVRRISIKPET